MSMVGRWLIQVQSSTLNKVNSKWIHGWTLSQGILYGDLLQNAQRLDKGIPVISLWGSFVGHIYSVTFLLPLFFRWQYVVNVFQLWFVGCIKTKQHVCFCKLEEKIIFRGIFSFILYLSLFQWISAFTHHLYISHISSWTSFWISSLSLLNYFAGFSTNHFPYGPLL